MAAVVVVLKRKRRRRKNWTVEEDEEVDERIAKEKNTYACYHLPPMNFQFGSSGVQDHRLHAIHQIPERVGE